MEPYHIIYAKKFKIIIIITLICGFFGGLFTFTQPLKYKATSRILVTQKSAFTLDPYTAIRSIELVGDNLAQIIKTSSFFENVLKAGYNINKDYFSNDEIKKRTLWQKTVDAYIVRGTGILVIEVYHPDREQALQIANAVLFVLNRDAADYLARDINLRLVDSPVLSLYPVKPSLPLNILAGMAVGFLLAHLWGYWDHRKKKHHGHLI